MQPNVLRSAANRPWTPVTVSLALSAVLLIALLMCGGSEAFVPPR